MKQPYEKMSKNQLSFSIPKKGHKISNRPHPLSLKELTLRLDAIMGQDLQLLEKYFYNQHTSNFTSHKGSDGQLIERLLGSDPKAGDKPDFSTLGAAGIELKTLPINQHLHPKETTFCSKISFKNIDNTDFSESRIRKKLAHVLWITIYRRNNKTKLCGYSFWQPSVSDWAIMENDWMHLMGALSMGRLPNAHEGKFLQLRPKAKNNQVQELLTTADESLQTLPLAFYLRTGLTKQFVSTQYL